VVLGLIRGEQTWTSVTGDAQRLPDRPAVCFSTDTRCDVGSVTKIIATTAALMRLIEDEQLELDTPVESIISAGLPGDITIVDLLEHQAGLWEWWPLYLRAATPEDAVALIAELPRRYPRRSGRHYSDLGFLLLGRVVAEIGGRTLEQVCTETVFEPFARPATRFTRGAAGGPVAASSHGDRIEQTMIDTGIPYPVHGRAADFDRWRDHALIDEVNDGNSFHVFGSRAGHAGVFSTVPDLLAFGRAILHSLAGVGPVGRSTVLRFVTAGDDPGQALGWRIWDTQAGPAIGHTGFPGVGLAIFPDRDAVLAMATNRLHVDGQPANLEALWRAALDPVSEYLAESTRAR
jgi:serine-type D-Ala-D-Ala carboxypeptidase